MFDYGKLQYPNRCSLTYGNYAGHSVEEKISSKFYFSYNEFDLLDVRKRR